MRKVINPIDPKTGKTTKKYQEHIDKKLRKLEGCIINRDKINNPDHYTKGRKFEPISVIEDWELGYHLGNALKYISRAGRKESKEEDLKKAIWYIERELKKE